MEMKIRQEHIYVPGLKNTYRFLHVTDNHIACYDERETPERAEYGAGRVEQFTVFGVSANYQRWFATMDFGGMTALKNTNTIYMALSRMINVSVGARF